MGRWKITASNTDTLVSFERNRQHEWRQAHIFGVHQNRIEFIVVNWISVLLFLMLTKGSQCNEISAQYIYSTQIEWLDGLVTRRKCESTSLHFIYRLQVCQLFQSSFQISRIMSKSHKMLDRYLDDSVVYKKSKCSWSI